MQTVPRCVLSRIQVDCDEKSKLHRKVRRLQPQANDSRSRSLFRLLQRNAQENRSVYQLPPEDIYLCKRRMQTLPRGVLSRIPQNSRLFQLLPKRANLCERRMQKLSRCFLSRIPLDRDASFRDFNAAIPLHKRLLGHRALHRGHAGGSGMK